ncbi:unnamed protein product [Ranitomeya imitator]|uniref:Flavin-containing monooxygenase n=1 Tax=Ranitomeya imitator TaxID=111125 RepID=A0ABN9LQ10_9NEOB|nr:unnamed protein product [Ranitomeya imitator]
MILFALAAAAWHWLLQTEVCLVTKSPSFSKTGQWEVMTEKNGIHDFKGRYIHSRFYKKYEEYREKTVLVVGIGNSAGDIAVEISAVAKQVYVSTRQGTWVLKSHFP